MIRKTVPAGFLPLTFTSWDKKKCILIATYAIIQCITEIGFACTVLGCLWKVELAMFEYDTLARIMYLYDWEACGVDRSNLPSNTIKELILEIPSNIEQMNIMPIRRTPVAVTESTRLSAGVRKHMKITIWTHVIWLIINLVIIIYTALQPPIIKNVHIMKFFLMVFQYSFIVICIYDISLAVMYITHIKQSLTKGMIIRYSGWYGLKMKDFDEFGGYLPLVATAFWLRGVIIFGFNCYCCSIIGRLGKKMHKREVSRMLFFGGYEALPDPARDISRDDNILYYRAGETVPHDERYIDQFFKQAQ